MTSNTTHTLIAIVKSHRLHAAFDEFMDTCEEFADEYTTFAAIMKAAKGCETFDALIAKLNRRT